MSEVVPFIQLSHKVNFLRKRNNDLKIIATNGCFDILHIGHVRYLQKAKTFGDVLIIGINSDESVRKLKGETRPINNEKNRSEFLAALSCVSMVTIFNEDSAEEFLNAVMPDIYVKGDDYDLDNLPEADFIKNNEIKFKTIPLIPGFSTTGMISKIKNG